MAPGSSDDLSWAMLSHLSFFVLPVLAPIVIMVTKGKQSVFVREQAVEALNFHITYVIAVVVSAVLLIVVIGVFTLVATFVTGLVFAILASIAAYRGDPYRYPVTLRVVK